MKNKLGNPLKTVDPFGGDSALRTQNTPLEEVRAVAPGARLPLFWLGAGQGSSADVANAGYFAQLLQLHEADVPLVILPGGGHTMGSWHAQVPPMLSWMTQGLAGTVAHDLQLALAKARAQPGASPAAKPSATPTK